jgi:hypothetical protein
VIGLAEGIILGINVGKSEEFAIDAIVGTGTATLITDGTGEGESDVKRVGE